MAISNPSNSGAQPLSTQPQSTQKSASPQPAMQSTTSRPSAFPRAPQSTQKSASPRPAMQSTTSRPSTFPRAPPNAPAAMNRGRGRARPQYVPYNTHRASRPENSSRQAQSFRAILLGRKKFGGLSKPPEDPTGEVQSVSRFLKHSEEWKDWQEVNIKIRRLPPKITTLDLYNEFNKYGHVEFIEIYLGRSGERDGGARVRFMPPPSRNFWSDKPYTFKTDRQPPETNIEVTAELSLDKPNRSFLIKSPVRSQKFYKEQMKVILDSIDFGFMVDPQTMMHMQEAPSLPANPPQPPKDAILTVDLMRKNLNIVFSFEFPDHPGIAGPGSRSPERCNTYRFRIPFEQVDQIRGVDINEDTTSLIISLSDPPCYFRKRNDINTTHSEDAIQWSEMDAWYRQTDIVPFNPGVLAKMPVSLQKAEVSIDIGRWTTYRLVMKKNDPNTPSILQDLREALKDFNLPVVPVEDFKIIPRVDPEIWDLMDPQHNGPNLMDSRIPSAPLPFEIRYQLEACISQGVLQEHNLTVEFLAALTELAQKDLAKARSILEYFCEIGERVYDPMSIFTNDKALNRMATSKMPQYCAHMRKATITPSCVYYSTPTVETTNRVLRHFEKVSDRFLRVQFMDEKFQGRIGPSVDKDGNNEVYGRVYRVLRNGVVIGDRTYKFLAFGNSQLRQNGAYFFCPNDEVTCEYIRAWMGNFRDIKVIAKYAARLGQCFSTTRAIKGSHGLRIERIPDIERNGFNFTDGVGKISNDLAEMIAIELNLPFKANIPSAFQFRLAGCKGVLVTWPDVPDKTIEIRPSQQKFETRYAGLEIIRCAQFSTATLNRQTITILSALGVEDHVFLGMLTKQLSNYELAMTDSDMALSLLQRWIDENHMTIVIASMILNGFMDSQEPFLMSLLHLWRSWSIKLLKEKAKIIVEDGAFVFGTIDETGILRGHMNNAKSTNCLGGKRETSDLPEIFLQVPMKGTQDKDKYRVIEGPCLVGRNPSLHPGDLRVVKAVKVPELMHLRDVVVFPQQGDRDIPGMCSGGDLDGDDFFVIWDEALIPADWNKYPMNYEAPAPKNKPNNEAVVVQDLMKFFVRFLKNDSLPAIAHAHLAQSDFLDRSVSDPKCLKLAELHSKAVDYVKTGESAVMPSSLRPRKWPHFMEKKHKPASQIYRSEKALGLLYDKVETVDFVPQYSDHFDKRILQAYKLDSEMLKSARQIKNLYDESLKRIMAQREIKTEFEIYITFILSKPRVGSDYKLQEEMGVESEALKERFRVICTDSVGSKDFSKLAPFVAAMYQVTYEEMRIAMMECRSTKIVGGREVPRRKMLPKYMPLISFPWIFHDILGKIAKGKDAQNSLEDMGMNILNQQQPVHVATGGARRRRAAEGSEESNEDYLEMEGGDKIHRGELLNLYSDSEGEDDEEGDDGPVAESFAPGENAQPVFHGAEFESHSPWDEDLDDAIGKSHTPEPSGAASVESGSADLEKSMGDVTAVNPDNSFMTKAGALHPKENEKPEPLVEIQSDASTTNISISATTPKLVDIDAEIPHMNSATSTSSVPATPTSQHPPMSPTVVPSQPTDTASGANGAKGDESDEEYDSDGEGEAVTMDGLGGQGGSDIDKLMRMHRDG